MRVSHPPQDLWKDIIEMYKNMPFLWDRNHSKYSVQSIRRKGYKALLDKYLEFDKTATVYVLKRKIDSMRNSYRRELKKVLASRKEGSDSEEHVPELWYFDLLSFLDDHLLSRKRVKSSSDDQYAENEENSDSNTTNEKSFWENVEYLEDFTNEDNSSTLESEPDVKHFKFNESDVTENVQDVSNVLDDDWTVIGKAIGVQIKNLDTKQSAIAQKLISDILFYAKLGKLSEESLIFVNK